MPHYLYPVNSTYDNCFFTLQNGTYQVKRVKNLYNKLVYLLSVFMFIFKSNNSDIIFFRNSLLLQNLSEANMYMTPLQRVGIEILLFTYFIKKVILVKSIYCTQSCFLTIFIF